MQRKEEKYERWNQYTQTVILIGILIVLILNYL